MGKILLVKILGDDGEIPWSPPGDKDPHSVSLLGCDWICIGRAGGVGTINRDSRSIFALEVWLCSLHNSQNIYREET